MSTNKHYNTIELQKCRAIMCQLHLTHWEMHTLFLLSKTTLHFQNSWKSTCCTPSPPARRLQTCPWASGSLSWHACTGSGTAETPVRTPYTRGHTGHTGTAWGLESTAGSPWGGRAGGEGEQRVRVYDRSRKNTQLSSGSSLGELRWTRLARV